VRKVLIPKGNGKTRLIYVPTGAQKKALRALLPELTRRAQSASLPGVMHGFVPGRSPVTNARLHIGKAYTATFDLKDFFDTVTEEHLPRLPVKILDQVLVEGSPRQGLPTSPAVANLAAARLDRAIMRWLKRHGDRSAVYTRYADDLTLSCNDQETLQAALAAIPELVRAAGFELAEAKTHVYDARAGRRIVTGVAVGEKDLAPTRRMKRRLRAAIHQGNTGEAEGLAEWCRLRLPRAERHQGRRPVLRGKESAVSSGERRRTARRRIVLRQALSSSRPS